MSAELVTEPISLARARLAQMTDTELVHLHLAGSELSFSELERRYGKQIFHFILSRVSWDKSRAEDITQQTFQRALRHLHKFRAGYPFMVWIRIIARNLIRNEYRWLEVRKNTFSIHEMKRVVPDNSRYKPDRILENKELGEILMEAINHLPQYFRETLILREIKGLEYNAIALILDTNVGTVKSRLYRARKAVAQEVRRRID